MKVSFWIYLFVLIFAPLAFASAELWSISTVEVLAGLSAVLFFCSLALNKEKLVRVPGLLPLLLLLLFMVLQLIPLPVSLVQLVSPATYDVYAPVLSITEISKIPLTINQNATLQEFLRIGCYSLFYILTVQLLSVSDHLKKTVYLIIGLAAAIGLLAIIQRVGSPDKIYWFRTVPENASPYGPWINPNQFAGFMEMLCPIALGLFLFFRPRFQPGETLRYKIVHFFSMPSSNLHMFLGFAASLMFLSVFISLCRGGIITITLAVFVFILLHRIKKSRQDQAAILAIIACVVIAVSWFGWDTIISEFNKSIRSDGSLQDGRLYIWTDSLRIFRSFFLFGSGFGTFIDIFPSYMSFPGFGVVDHAHNDYLELLTDGGIIGGGLTAWFVISVTGHGWKMIRQRRDQYAVLIGIGALTGILAMLMHSSTDFNMHNGAVGLYFFFCCGLLVAVTNIRFLYFDTKTALQKQATVKTKYYLLSTLLFCAITSFVQYGTLMAQRNYNSTAHIYVSQHLNSDLIEKVRNSLKRAIIYAPLNALYTYKLAAIEILFHHKQEALTTFLRSARQNPMNGSTLHSIAHLIHDEEQAELLLKKGYERDLDDDTLALTFVTYLLKNDQRERATLIMAKRLKKHPRLLEIYAHLFDTNSFTRDQIILVLSDSIDNWFKYASLLEKNNRLYEAEFFYRSALEQLGNEEKIKPHWFQKLIQFYQKNEQPDLALVILRQATEILPDYIPFHLQLGDYYRKEGIQFRAKEEYERVLMLQPGNMSAVKRLRGMGLMDSY